jgi:hypothetical protein
VLRRAAILFTMLLIFACGGDDGTSPDGYHYPLEMVAHSGDGQAQVGGLLDENLVALFRDRDGTGVENVRVKFYTTNDEPQCGGPLMLDGWGMTDDYGFAPMGWELGPVGTSVECEVVAEAEYDGDTYTTTFSVTAESDE